MSNTLIFKDTKIWRNDIDTENGTYYAYSISVSSKNQDGSWDNAYLPVRFSKNANAPAKISNGTIANLEGFLTVKKRKDAKNEVQFMVMQYTSDEEQYQAAEDSDIPDNFEQAESEIPF